MGTTKREFDRHILKKIKLKEKMKNTNKAITKKI